MSGLPGSVALVESTARMAGRRFFMVFGCARYPAGFDSLPVVPGYVSALRAALSGLGLQDAVPGFGLDPDRAGFQRLIQGWLGSGQRQADDELLFFFLGHGGREDRHYLELTDGGFATEDLFREFARQPRIGKVAIVLDTCFAGEAILDIGRIAAFFEAGLDSAQMTVILVASSWAEEEAAVGGFTPAFLAALRNETLALGGFNQAEIQLTPLLEEVNNQLPAHQRTQVQPYPASQCGKVRFALPNPRFDPAMPPEIDLETLRRLHEGTHWQALTQYFTGRQRALAEIAAWLGSETSGGRVLVVTGAPGTGKSALLGRIITQGWPGLVYLDTKQMALPEVVRILARSLDLANPLNQGGDVKPASVEAFVRSLRERAEPALLVLDSLDEAMRPGELTAQLLKPLAGCEHLWILVGTRPNALVPDTGRRFRDLGDQTREINLDDDRYLGQDDVADYVFKRLMAPVAEGGSALYHGQPACAQAAAQVIAAQAGNVFLIAKLACDQLIRDRRDPRLDRPWEQLTLSDLPSVFDGYLRQFNERGGGWSRSKAVNLLAPLAYAQGQGLPGNELWLLLAATISGTRYDRCDVLDLMAEAAPYLVQSLEDGLTVYRLFHKAFAEHLLTLRPLEDSHAQITRALMARVPTGPDGRNWLLAEPYLLRHLVSHAAAGHCLDELLADPGFLIAADPMNLRWTLAGLESEAARAVLEVHTMASLQPEMEPGDRASHLELTAQKLGHEALAQALHGILPVRPWHPRRAAWKAQTVHAVISGVRSPITVLAVVRLDRKDVFITGSEDGSLAFWRADTQRRLGRVIAGHQGPVTGLACGRWNGRQVMVSAGRDGAVRLWDLSAQEPIDLPLPESGPPVQAVVFSESRKRPLIIAAGEETGIQVWDLSAPGPALQVSSGEGILAMAVGLRNNKKVLIYSCADGMIRLLGLDSLGPATQAKQPHLMDCRKRFTALKVVKRGRSSLLLCGSDQGSLQLWELGALKRVERESTHQPGAVTGVAWLSLADQDLILSGGQDGWIRIWDNGTFTRPPRIYEGHRGPVIDLATCGEGARSLIVSAGEDRTLRLWQGRQPASAAGKRNTQPVSIRAMLLVQRQGAPILVYAGPDGSIHGLDPLGFQAAMVPWTLHRTPVVALIRGRGWAENQVLSASEDAVLQWDLATGRVLGPAIGGFAGAIRAIAYLEHKGRPILASGHAGGQICLVDLLNHRLLRPVIHAHAQAVTSLATGVAAGRACLVSASDDGRVRIWDVATGTALGPQSEPGVGPVTALLNASVAGTPVLVSARPGTGIALCQVDPVRTLQTLDRPEPGRVHALCLAERGPEPLLVWGGEDGVLHCQSTGTGSADRAVRLDAPVRAILPFQDHFLVGTDDGLVALDFPG